MLPLPSQEVMTSPAKYLINFHKKAVHGVLTITPTRLYFEPDLDDKNVILHGLLTYTFSIDVSNLVDCFEIPGHYITAMYDIEAQGDDGVLELYWVGKKTQGTVHFIISRNKCGIMYSRLLEMIPKLAENATQKKVNLEMVHQALVQLRSRRGFKSKRSPNFVFTASTEESRKDQSILMSSSAGDSVDNSFSPVMKAHSDLFGNVEFELLRQNLPGYNKYADWELLYSTQAHGISFNTFQMKTADRVPTLIVIEDSNGYVFGGFCSEAWSKHTSYFGTGQSFLFTLKPKFNIYHWTRANDYVMLMDLEHMSMGGGPGSDAGLWIDCNFEFGGSAPSETFGNKCLASSEDFKCAVLEVWGFSS